MQKDQPILTISTAASLLGLHPRTLMSYDKAGLISPHRTSTRRRMFSGKDLDEIQFLKYLSRKRKINIEGIKAILEIIRITEGQGINIKKSLFPDFRVRNLL